MSTVIEKTSATAHDTLARKSRDEGIVSGGHLVARALRNEGVDTVFTLCGGHIIDIYDGCLDEGIRIVDMRHEQTAAHAADGYARQTGRLGCVVTTAGPGCTNAVTGVATAFRSESPILHIGGQSSLAQHRMGSLQDLPHVDMMTPITKFASGVFSTERVADMIAMAARECFNGAYGPAYLEIPRDILDAEIPLEKARIPAPGSYRVSTKSIGDPADIEKLADILVASERPAVLFGQQVWSSGSHGAAIDFVRALDIPAYMNGASRGMLPEGDAHHFDRTRSDAFKEADVILIVGTPFDFRMGYGRRISEAATLIQIDQSYATVGKNRDISLGLAGDPGAILTAVAQAATGRIDKGARGRRLEWMARLRGIEAAKLERLMPMFLNDASPIHPYRLAWEINEFLAEDTIYIGDGGDIVTISAQAVRPRRPGQWMDPGALGSLGVGTGFAMAAKLAHPRQGGGLPLRRRLVRHDRLRHGDRAALRRALSRDRRQQLGDEPDPLRPDGQIRRAARQCRQQARRCRVLDFRQDDRRPRRGGPRGFRDRAGARARPRGDRQNRQMRRRQCLGRPQRVRAGDQSPDHVQVILEG